jgi:hypothetical protein
MHHDPRREPRSDLSLPAVPALREIIFFLLSMRLDESFWRSKSDLVTTILTNNFC